MASKSLSNWLVPIGTHCEKPDLSLFCFPPAGAGALFFARWSLLVPDGVNIWAIRFPGRETRRNEPLLTRWPELIDQLLAALSVHCHKPFICFGHSLGALVSFEIAYQLQQNIGHFPKALVLSGKEPPHRSRNNRDYRREDWVLQEELRVDGGTPETILQNLELMAIYLPIYRADLQLNQNYPYCPNKTIDCPLLVLGGDNDQSVSIKDLAAWRNYTQGGFQFQRFPGGHMYLTQESERFAVIKTLLGFVMSVQ